MKWCAGHLASPPGIHADLHKPARRTDCSLKIGGNNYRNLNL